MHSLVAFAVNQNWMISKIYISSQTENAGARISFGESLQSILIP